MNLGDITNVDSSPSFTSYTIILGLVIAVVYVLSSPSKVTYKVSRSRGLKAIVPRNKKLNKRDKGLEDLFGIEFDK